LPRARAGYFRSSYHLVSLASEAVPGLGNMLRPPTCFLSPRGKTSRL
jgi:hypothetical protein